MYFSSPKSVIEKVTANTSGTRYQYSGTAFKGFRRKVKEPWENREGPMDFSENIQDSWENTQESNLQDSQHLMWNLSKQNPKQSTVKLMLIAIEHLCWEIGLTKSKNYQITKLMDRLEKEVGFSVRLFHYLQLIRKVPVQLAKVGLYNRHLSWIRFLQRASFLKNYN